MNNYEYIITGFPLLSSEFEAKSFSYEHIANEVRPLLSKKDNRLIDWLEFSFDVENLSSHYYSEALKSKNIFINSYLVFDRKLRNTLALSLAKAIKKDAKEYLIGEIDASFEEYRSIQSTFEIKNIVEREKQIDRIRWNKINNIVTFEYFSINTILAILAKAKLIDRWSKLDKEEGAKLFKEFVQEVRGTYEGVQK